MTTIGELLNTKFNNFKKWMNDEVLRDKTDEMANNIRNKLDIPDDNVLRLAILTKLFSKFTVEEAINIYKTEIGYSSGYFTVQQEDKMNRYISCFYEIYKQSMN